MRNVIFAMLALCLLVLAAFYLKYSDKNYSIEEYVEIYVELGHIHEDDAEVVLRLATGLKEDALGEYDIALDETIGQLVGVETLRGHLWIVEQARIRVRG